MIPGRPPPFHSVEAVGRRESVDLPSRLKCNLPVRADADLHCRCEKEDFTLHPLQDRPVMRSANISCHTRPSRNCTATLDRVTRDLSELRSRPRKEVPDRRRSLRNCTIIKHLDIKWSSLESYPFYLS